MKMTRISPMLIIVILVFSGCDSTPSKKLDFRTIEQTQSSKISEQRFVVVKDLNAWKTLWTEHTKMLVLPLPEVNFSQEMVVGVFLGTRSNTCYRVTIESVEQIANQRILVKFREQKPNPGSVCGRAETEPTHLIAMEVSDLLVEFSELE